MVYRSRLSIVGKSQRNLSHLASTVADGRLGIRLRGVIPDDPNTVSSDGEMVARKLEMARRRLRSRAKRQRIRAMIEGASHLPRLHGVLASSPLEAPPGRRAPPHNSRGHFALRA